MISKSWARHFLVGLTLLAAGCGDSGNIIGPQNQPEVANSTDTFQWQVTALSDVSQTLTYSWVNTGVTANVNQSSSITSGSAALRVTDDAGLEVYARSLAENGTFETDAGTAGTWTVSVTLTEASGSLNFRLQKP